MKLKSFQASLVLIFLMLAFATASAEVVMFEELDEWSNDEQTYFNGAGTADLGWTSGGVTFNNSYNATFGSWSGWSYSRVENSTTPGFGNQYAAFPGGGFREGGGKNPGENYAVAYGFAKNVAFFNLPQISELESVNLTNTTYAAISMRDGDAFGKKFGGDDGTDEDYFKVTLRGYDRRDVGGDVTGEVEFYLADFRFESSDEDYIVDAWEEVDLTGLGRARSVGIEFESTDVGQFGINTPTYVALDQLKYVAVPEAHTVGFLSLLGFGILSRLVWRRRRS